MLYQPVTLCTDLRLQEWSTEQPLECTTQERDRRKEVAAQKAVDAEGVQKAKLLLRRQSMVSLH